ncbi:MAG TPA: hypothetical protein VLA05_06350 [Coriobacteriia bacterium]|nr:hypothetical protein [Coriobacteriia bacterium]
MSEETTAPEESTPVSGQQVERRLVITSPKRHMLLVAILLIGAVAIVAFLLLGYRTFTLRLDAARRLDQATTLVQDSDRVVVEIDSVVRAEMEPELGEKARDAIQRVDDADVMLTRAVQLIDQARPDLNDDEREQADLLKASAVTRQKMLDPAPEILEANASAASALPPATEGWEGVVEADKVSDRAVTAYNKLTKAGVRDSQKLNRSVAGILKDSRENFESAEDAFPAAPFEQYLKYLGVRIEMNKLSQRSDAAWLKDNLSGANKIIKEYNRKDERAVELAKDLPSTPEQAIAEAYAETTKQLTDEYYAAREKALEADRLLREH